MLLFVALTILHISVFAQWQVEESYDSGKPYLKGFAQSNDKEATLFVIPYEDNVAMSMQTSNSFVSEFVEVKFTFVVNGTRKTHEFLGMTNKKGQILLFQIEHISSPFVGSFLRDFKAATGLTVSVEDENKTYDFDNGTFDVKIIVDGYEIKPEPFFELLERNFDRLVGEKANERINEMLPNSFSEDMDNMKIKINNVYESMQNDISKIVSKYRDKMLNKHFSN